MLKDKMSFDLFKRYLQLLRRNNEMINKIYNDSNKTIDIINLDSELTEPYRIIEKLFFTINELEMISWYLYENVEKKIYEGKTDKVICEINTDEDLWNYLNNETQFDPKFDPYNGDCDKIHTIIHALVEGLI